MIPKFRAWITERQVLVKVHTIHFNTQKIIVSGFTEYGGNTSVPFSKAILMQSTGLFDKNGVEIFEGDLLKMDDGSKGLIKVEAVESGNFTVKVFLSTEHSAYIIGNIHEHPHLVEGCG